MKKKEDYNSKLSQFELIPNAQTIILDIPKNFFIIPPNNRIELTIKKNLIHSSFFKQFHLNYLSLFIRDGLRRSF